MEFVHKKQQYTSKNVKKFLKINESVFGKNRIYCFLVYRESMLS